MSIGEVVQALNVVRAHLATGRQQALAIATTLRRNRDRLAAILVGARTGVVGETVARLSTAIDRLHEAAAEAETAERTLAAYAGSINGESVSPLSDETLPDRTRAPARRNLSSQVRRFRGQVFCRSAG